MAVYFIVLAGLVFASYHDIKTREIPVFIFPLIGVICSILNAVRIYQNPGNWKMEVIMLIAGGGLYGLASLFLMLKKKMGGADVYMFVFIGLSIGFIAMTEATIVACVVGLILFLINRKKKEYPFAPMLLAGVSLVTLLRLILL